MADDYGCMDPQKGDDQKKGEKSKAAVKEGSGIKRPWLKCFETLPPQLLNAYGEAKFSKLSDAEVWRNFCEPLKSGAEYMTELCANDHERRGVGINRWLHAMVMYCEYQLDPMVKRWNEALLVSQKCEELYDEIKRVLPSLKYCLVPSFFVDVSETKSVALLDKHGQVLYEWLNCAAVSRVRMLAQWQCAGGIAFTAGVHHRVAQCFRYYGNSMHEGEGCEVSLMEFQEVLKQGHEVGGAGIEAAGSELEG